MKQNKYDEEEFFDAYGKMERSLKGLEGAGEWHVLRSLIPELRDRSVLDLGCGYGWHCLYAHEQGASDVTGIDISAKMLEKASTLAQGTGIQYMRLPIEDIVFPPDRFDVVISSLAFHYVEDFSAICEKIYNCMKLGGTFLFSVEHPVFTARSEQSWEYGEDGKALYWPLDNYQSEGQRVTSFLTDNVVKYHRTLATYINAVIQVGFVVTAVAEPKPAEDKLDIPGMRDELRRPMFLIISATR
ncbi:bifunctional 2-polyprenyl-6-hydroxyphenol methylase/3-demethylubiquinol 3-O-methyltransferase UbiG [Paenibacillus sp. PAMC21692]|uniref:class I SAM-dependent methyltransferase n=1 Tax=Paenibacillus sp. PAMC21692 TaxID=2762320 RepID=UPI00164EC3EC|nr:class I SAM-dependent methyltransferase [Paenibacillus sp. PAMC21692]QNK56412.1 methyltransferase domain-containing protein [Paenibacillus sp. PAMC21692]